MAASCTFLPGSKVAISSKTFNISVVSVSFGVSLVSFLMHGFLVVFFFTFVVKFSFLKSVESISVLIKWAASAGILFGVSFLGRKKI